MSRTVTDILPYTELEVAGPYDGHTGNYDQSRSPIDRIIIHTMAGTWQGAAARFDNPTSNVSAHYGIKLDGGLIHWLEETFTAYHSGDYAMNQRSIGIEHEDGGDYNGLRPDILYQTSAKLVADICRFYNIPCDREHIRAHYEVSDKPTACPDTLDIERIVREAEAILNPPPPVPEITDQTKIPLNVITALDTYTEKEVHVIRSDYIAKDQSIKDHQQANKQQAEIIHEYQVQVEDLNNDLGKLQKDFAAYKTQQESIPVVPQTPPNSVTPPKVESVPNTSFTKFIRWFFTPWR